MQPPGPASQLRILHVVSAYYPAVRYGGPIRSVHGLAAALARRGHDVHVYTTNVDGASDMDVPTDRPVALDDVAVHYFPVPALRRLWWSPALGRKLRESVHTFDVVHVHAAFLWPMYAAARAASRSGVPYVVAPRGMLIRDAINGKSRFAKIAWINLVERTTLARAAAVHVTAELEGQELRALGLPARRLSCIPNGVEWPQRYASLEEGPFADLPERFVLFLSRLSWKKGLDRLIKAWQWIPDVPLIIAGGDDEGYQRQLTDLIRATGVSDRVRFIGPARDEHKWALYARARLFVLPSYSENFGNAVAEAMAVGCPVLVSPQVGIASLVESTGAGVVADCEPRALAAEITRLLRDPGPLQEMGSKGREAVRRCLSWSAVAAQAESLYCGIAQ